MRIALFLNLPSGGAKRAVYEWIRRLTDSHIIDAYTLSTANHAFCDIRPLVAHHTIYEFAVRKMFRSPLGRINQLQRWRDLGDLVDLHRRIAGEINAGGYDVLFAQPCAFTFIPALLRFIEIPSVYYLHEPIVSSYLYYERPYESQGTHRMLLNRFDPMLRAYWQRLGDIQWKSVNKTEMFLANSQFTAGQHKSVFGKEAEVNPLGVDIDQFHPLENSIRGNYIVSVGEMTPRKGFDFIIESLAGIPLRDRPVLKMACNNVDGKERKFIEDLAEKKQVRIEILSGLGAPELKVLYSQARFCVYAPISEPFGLVPLEAMACGTPVIGVREGGVQESIVHEFNGLLVDRDAGQFGEAIQRLIAMPELAETFGRNAREYVTENWTWERSVSNLSNYLEECSKSD